MLLNYVNNYIDYKPNWSNPENDSSKKIEKTRNCIRIGIIISSIIFFVGAVLFIKYLKGENPFPIIVGVFFPCGLIFPVVYVSRYYCEVFNHDCGDNTDEKLLIFELVFKDASILLIVSLVVFFIGYFLWLVRLWTTRKFLIVCAVGLVLFILSLFLGRKNYEKLSNSKTRKEARNQVVHSLRESKITTKKQIERLNNLLKDELKRCDEERNAIDTNLDAIVCSVFVPLVICIFEKEEKIPIEKGIIIGICLIIAALLLLYYLHKKTISSNCKCSTKMVYDSYYDLQLFIDDPQLLEDIKKEQPKES